MFLICIIFCGLAAGCKKELPPASVDKSEQAKVKKGHRELGLELYEKGKNTEAIAEFKKVIEIEPNHVEAHYELGLVYVEEGLCDDGIGELKKVLEIDPKYEDAYYSLGDAYYDCNRKDDALKVWKTLLKDNPEDSIFHYNLGVIYRDKGQFKNAILELQKAIASDPNNDNAKKLLNQLTTKKQRVKSTGDIKKNKKKAEKKNTK